MIVQKAKTVERAQAGRIYLRIPVLLLTGLLTTNGCQSIQDLFQPTEETGDYNFPWDGPLNEEGVEGSETGDPTNVTENTDPEPSPESIDPEKDSRLQIEDKTKTDRGREIVTRFYGAELIRQRIYINGKPEWRIQLRGNATIRHGNVLIRAPSITIDAGKYGKMTGGVQIYDSDNGIFIRAAQGVYNRDKETVQLLGWPYMRIKKPGQETTHITCVKMERDLAEKIAYLKEDVRIHHSDYNILADKASYTDAKEMIEIPDNPRILGKGEYLTGDRILYYTGEEKAILEGKTLYATYEPETITVPNLENYARLNGPLREKAIEEARKEAEKRGETLPDPDAEQKKPTGPVLQVLSADRIEHLFADKKNPVTKITGNVIFTDPTRELRSPALVGTGPSMAVLSTDQGVEFIDKEENIRVKSREMEYKRQEQFLTLTGDPLVEFLDEETGEVTGTLTGAFIERDFQAEVTLARGNVELNRGEDRARGEIARYEEKD
ncbi:MAG TPA: hypothetical protein DEA96_15515, partial [Leptospiraceae bacterium]|nr:hypothetical protein [Leptospiraceae bacterium]